MSVVAYVSGHGLGHAAREVGVLGLLPPDVPLVIKSRAPEWFWRQQIARPFTLIPDAFDVGCVQQNGLDIDVPATLRAWQEMDARNRDEDRYGAEAVWLREVGARLVVSDVPALPLVAAARAGVPSVAVVNFTWADIYRHFAAEYPAFGTAADALEAEYARATLALTTGFSLPMPYFPRQESVGYVARPGRSRRDALFAAIPEAARQKRIALVYVGGWGLPIPYARVEALTDWHFLSLDAPPEPPANWTVLARDLMEHPDLVASVDCVVSKPGYGLAAECISLGTPLLYCPRPAFAEYPALDRELSAWPGGIRLPVGDFLAVNWQKYLHGVPQRGATPVLAAPGGSKAAAILRRMAA